MSSGCLPSPVPGGGRPAGGQRIGVLLAAGRSQRMGCPKLALPWPPTEQAIAEVPPLGADDRRAGRDGSQTRRPAAVEAAPRTIIGHVHDVLAAWCSSMIVVLGADADVVRGALGRRPRREVIGDGAASMFDSVRRGLLAARDHGAELILLAPADHVGVDATDIGALLAAAAAEPDRIHLPQAGERGGHPVVVPSTLVPVILEWSGTDGLAGLWRARPDLVRRHLGASPMSCRDIDTPDAYRGS